MDLVNVTTYPSAGLFMAGLTLTIVFNNVSFSGHWERAKAKNDVFHSMFVIEEQDISTAQPRPNFKLSSLLSSTLSFYMDRVY